MSGPPLRCQLCGDVIGTYEPMIVRAGGMVRETSRVADLDLSPDYGEHYHGGCYGSRSENHAINQIRPGDRRRGR